MAWHDTFFASEAWKAVQRVRYAPERAAAIASGICGRLGLRPGTSLLDVPCGNGPLSVAIARHGVHVTGVDSDRGWIEEAGRAARDAGLSVDFQVGDMRELPPTGRFDAALSWWSSFGYFDDAGNEAHASALRRTLRPGGALLLELASLETFCGRWVERTWSEVAGVRMLEARALDAMGGRLRTEWTLQRGGHTETLQSDLWLPSCRELVTLLRRVGFSSFEVTADLDGRPFVPGSRLVLLARTPAA